MRKDDCKSSQIVVRLNRIKEYITDRDAAVCVWSELSMGIVLDLELESNKVHPQSSRLSACSNVFIPLIPLLWKDVWR